MIITCPYCDEKNNIPEITEQKSGQRFRCRYCQLLIPHTNSSDTSPERSGQRGSEIVKTRWVQSLQFKMSLILIVITTTIFSAFVTYSYITEKKQNIAQLSEIAKITSKRIAGSLSDPFWNIDKQMINDIMTSEMQEKRMYSIAIRDIADDTVVFDKMRKFSGQNDSHLESGRKNLISEKVPIIKGDNVIGHLEVSYSKKFIDIDIRNTIARLAINAIILTISIVLTAVLFLRKMIIAPIKELSDATLRMSIGDLNAHIRTDGKDEIGLLSQSIQRVQTSMGIALKKLRK